MRNKIGITLLIIGGVLMIISFAIGTIGVYEFIYSWITENIPSDLDWIRPILLVFLEVLRWIANLGGFTVIFGALFIALEQYRFGKWFVSIGLTFGTLTLIIWIVSQFVDLSDIITNPQILNYLDRVAEVFESNTIFQISGVIIAIVGRNFVKKPKKPKEVAAKLEEVEITEISKEDQSKPPIPFQNIYCPNCGASLPFNAEFCSECGQSIERK